MEDLLRSLRSMVLTAASQQQQQQEEAGQASCATQSSLAQAQSEPASNTAAEAAPQHGHGAAGPDASCQALQAAATHGPILGEGRGQGAGEGPGADDGRAAGTPPHWASAERMQRKPLLPSFDLEGVAQLISAGAVGRIVVMCGAGISVSAGIPDFRTPGTGLYSQLARYNLPRPEAVFSLSFFRSNPRPFTQLAAELLPGRFTPTPTHYFLALLHRKGLLLRCFTQNIDSLESVAGLPAEAVVAAHGNFDSASCIDCGRPHPIDWVKAQLLAGNISHCSLCGSLVKPDIVFFGEALPQRFHQLRRQDLQRCDLLIVMGTSLVVQPFAGLLYDVPTDVPRLLMNREVVGLAEQGDDEDGEEVAAWHRAAPTLRSSGFDFRPGRNYRDALYLGDCDGGVKKLAQLLGWQDELEQLVKEGRAARAPGLALATAQSTTINK